MWSGRARSRLGALLGGLLVVGAGWLTYARRHGAAPPSAPRRFDYYRVALSWSPSFCARHPEATEQCGGKGYGFVLHGLWPSSLDGVSPENCGAEPGPDDETVAKAMAFMPSRSLIQHEWRAHGTCSDLGARDYFDRAREGFARVRVPATLSAPGAEVSMTAEELSKAFEQVNPGLDDGMITVVCREGAELQEVRVCVDKASLSVTSCGAIARDSCPPGKLRIPTLR